MPRFMKYILQEGMGEAGGAGGSTVSGNYVVGSFPVQGGAMHSGDAASFIAEVTQPGKPAQDTQSSPQDQQQQSQQAQQQQRRQHQGHGADVRQCVRSRFRHGEVLIPSTDSEQIGL